MNARIELFETAEILEDFFREILGMRRDEAKPFEARQRCDRSREIAEIVAACRIAPRVDRLTDQNDFARAWREPFSRLVENRAFRPVIEAAPDVRNDAERAVVRTAALHRDEGAQVRKGSGYR